MLVFNTETFMTSNDLVPGEGTRTELHVMFLNMYYAYTTLSTVGFGDLNPRSDIERLLCIVIFLLGVGIFALFMGLFLEIIAKFNAYGEDLDESHDLLRFFTAIASYNRGVEMGIEWRRKFEKYFDYRWSHNKHLALEDEADRSTFDQIPPET